MSFSGKTALVTGGTGSFGRAVVAPLLARGVREIRIFSRDEYKQERMRIEMNEPRLRFMIGDVRDPGSVDAAMRGVDFVFHAAALKQVPSCDFFPMQAVLTNIAGSQNVIDAAVRHEAGSVVCLSTDKAVYPINAMGMTKALMEKVAQATARQSAGTGTVISTVRYGNVLYSRGSVIPLFVRQMLEGRPVTITDPDMTRFLLPLPEAIQLVLFAFEHGGQGDILVRKAPACTVQALVDALRQLLDVKPEVRVIGTRHGEKVYETLATREELRRADDLGDYYRIPMDTRDLNYEKYFTEGDTEEAATEDYTSHNTERLDTDAVARLLLTLPEIRSAIETRAAPGGV